MLRDRPIPAFYCCYLLRSIIRNSAVYVGSTPNPARRLRQHNGLVKGGAARTSRESLRPWEMACIVAGFPSQIAALQFEWAWQNPHITLHIPPKSRLQHATQKKRSGQPKRPRHTVSSLLSNLHLLLRVPLFCRWPLELRFYSQDVYASWLKVTKSATEPIRESISIIQDFSQTREPLMRGDEGADLTKSDNECSGIYMINIGYTSQTAYLEKSKSVFDFEQEDRCAICNKPLEHDMGIHTLCPSPDCAAVTHIRCLSARFTKEIDDSLVPVVGVCPSCNTELRWVDVMKELSLRMRGKKDVDDLLTRRRTPRAVSLLAARAGLDTDEDLMGKEEHVQIQEDRVGMEEPKHENSDSHFDELWHIIDNSQESDTEFPP